jgi:transcriptional regulator with XRE-family HTH domain
MDTNRCGYKLKALRRQRKLSRAALGAMVNRSAVAMGKYERGEKSPPPEVIEALVAWSGGALSLSDFVLPTRRIAPTPACPSSDRKEDAAGQSHCTDS